MVYELFVPLAPAWPGEVSRAEAGRLLDYQ
jgi:hypothetical protein